MIGRKKNNKGKQKRHRTNDPRRLTAEGWWRRKAKAKGRVLRPAVQEIDPR